MVSIKPRIQIRFVFGKIFYHVQNAYVNDYNIQFLGSFDINELYKQILRDKIECREDTKFQ